MILFYLLPLFVGLLALYSYGYLDYNLTLSNNPLFLRFVGHFQDLVFFHRPLSTDYYLAFVITLTLLYLLILRFAPRVFPWPAAVVVGLIAALAYPMFTHDLFNYLFHARIVVTYHQNPHLLAPQVFVGDQWLRFMHWVHSPSAYGYTFTAYMLIPYILGLTKLTSSLYLYKLLSFGWYLLAIWLVGQIARRVGHPKPVLAQLLFAFNPLLILEWLINAHNDNLMVTLMLLSWWLIGKGKNPLHLVRGWLVLLVAGLAKYAALILAPSLLLTRLLGEKRALYLSSFVLLLTPFLYHYDTQYQVWYITWALPFVILTGSRLLTAGMLGYTLGGLATYVPYIATGFWTLSPDNRTLTFLLPSLLGIGISLLMRKAKT